MSTSEKTIRINFQMAKKQADELDQIANDLDKVASGEFENVMNKISMDWKGESSAAYFKKGTKLQDDLLKTTKSIRNAATEIRTVAERIYRAEMEALRIASVRDN